jgi:hypothetical protein
MPPCDWQSNTYCYIGQMWTGTMYWHVKARNANGQEGDWSDTWSFTIQEIPSTLPPPWLGQGCNTPHTGPGGLRAGDYDPNSLTQEKRQWLFEVFGNSGIAPVGYGGQTCPWQNTSPPQQPWFGQGCNSAYTGPGGLQAGSYDPNSLSQERRQWLFEVFGNYGTAPVGYGGVTCPWQTIPRTSSLAI